MKVSEFIALLEDYDVDQEAEIVILDARICRINPPKVLKNTSEMVVLG